MDSAVRKQVDDLKEKLKQLAEKEKVEERVAYLTEKIEEITDMLKNIEQSEEAEQLKKALQSLRERVQEELNKL